MGILKHACIHMTTRLCLLRHAKTKRSKRRDHAIVDHLTHKVDLQYANTVVPSKGKITAPTKKNTVCTLNMCVCTCAKNMPTYVFQCACVRMHCRCWALWRRHPSHRYRKGLKHQLGHNCVRLQSTEKPQSASTFSVEVEVLWKNANCESEMMISIWAKQMYYSPTTECRPKSSLSTGISPSGFKVQRSTTLAFGWFGGCSHTKIHESCKANLAVVVFWKFAKCAANMQERVRVFSTSQPFLEPLWVTDRNKHHAQPTVAICSHNKLFLSKPWRVQSFQKPTTNTHQHTKCWFC